MSCTKHQIVVLKACRWCAQAPAASEYLKPCNRALLGQSLLSSLADPNHYPCRRSPVRYRAAAWKLQITYPVPCSHSIHCWRVHLGHESIGRAVYHTTAIDGQDGIQHGSPPHPQIRVDHGNANDFACPRRPKSSAFVSSSPSQPGALPRWLTRRRGHWLTRMAPGGLSQIAVLSGHILVESR